MGEVLREQDCLDLVVEHGGHSTTARVVGAMGCNLYGAEQSPEVLDALSGPATRLVTLTITGNGYLLSADGEFSVGVDDRWPVITEPFSQWVGRPPRCCPASTASTSRCPPDLRPGPARRLRGAAGRPA